MNELYIQAFLDFFKPRQGKSIQALISDVVTLDQSYKAL